MPREQREASQSMTHQRGVREPAGSGKRGGERDAARDSDKRLLRRVGRSLRRLSALCRPSRADDQRR